MHDQEPRPRTAIDRGPSGEEALSLSDLRPEVLPEAGGDSIANELDANVGGASASAGLDSGGAVGVRRGLAVGRPGAEYDTAPDGETGSDIEVPPEMEASEESAEEEEDEVLDSLSDLRGHP